jgi:hypothetical protein
MTLNIAHYTAKSNPGIMAQSGGNDFPFLSNDSVLSDLFETRTIFGTPLIINRAPLNSYAHMTNGYVKIVRDLIAPIPGQDQLFVPDRLRIKVIGGVCVQANSILYAWAASPTASPFTLRWQMLFANAKVQPLNTFIDIDLPDNTYYPSLYLALILIDGGFAASTEVDPSQDEYQCPGNLPFYCLNPSFNIINPNERHMISSQGRSQYNGLYTRVVIAFEDMPFMRSDRDYNDVVLSLSSVFLDETHTNDSAIS